MAQRTVEAPGVISGVSGALLISVGRILSSLLWVYVGVRQREWSLTILSLAYITIDLVGMWRWSTVRG